jgi:hypothetical protein
MCRLLLARRALVAAMFTVLLVPSAAWAEAPSPSACKGLYHGDPPGSIVMTTSPSGATVLHPGEAVEVTAMWNAADWPSPVLHKVLDCLLVDGEVDYDHSSQEKPTANDGYYRYRFTVPAGARGRICDRVRLSGRFVDDGELVVQKSNTVCFSIAAVTGDTGVPGVPSAPPEVTTQTATPVEEGTPAPLQPLEPAAAEVPAPGGAIPAPPLEISAVSLPTLPRTGADPFPLVRVGALLILGGGAASLGGRRPPRIPEGQRR